MTNETEDCGGGEVADRIDGERQSKMKKAPTRTPRELEKLIDGPLTRGRVSGYSTVKALREAGFLTQNKRGPGGIVTARDLATVIVGCLAADTPKVITEAVRTHQNEIEKVDGIIDAVMSGAPVTDVVGEIEYYELVREPFLNVAQKVVCRMRFSEIERFALWLCASDVGRDVK